MKHFKITFRVTIMTILLTILIVTVGIVGYTAFRGMRFTAQELGSQVLEQTSVGVEERILALFRTATEESDLLTHYITQEARTRERTVTRDDFPDLIAYMYQVMRVHPEFSFISLSIESTGEYCHVQRRPEGGLVLQENHRRTPEYVHRYEYRMTESGPEVFRENPNWPYDPRTRPFYVAAREAKRPVWTEVYLFINDPGPDMPGITYASPMYYEDGSLLGVLTVDFTLEDISQFLGDIRIGETGYAFLVEQRGDNEYQLIAHPDPDLVLKRAEDRQELATLEDLAGTPLDTFNTRAKEAVASGELVRGMLQIQFRHGNVLYFGSGRTLREGNVPNWIVCTLVPAREFMGQVRRHNVTMIAIGLAGFLVAILVSMIVSARISRPLRYLANEADRIARLEIEPKPVWHSMVLEVDQLATAAEKMKAGLASFEKYVPSELVREMLAVGQEATIGGERRRITTYFADIVGFTPLAERMDPEDLVGQLGEYLDASTRDILDSGGTVDKYYGDNIMAFWGAPAHTTHHARDACVTAVRNQRAMARLREKWAAEDKPQLHACIGINTGEAVVGNMGSDVRLNYTAVGDSVNLASRLEELCRHYGAEVLVSEHTYEEAKRAVVGRPIDRVVVRGRREPVLVYELLAIRGQDDKETLRLADLFERALAAYRERRWDEAMRLYEEALDVRPDDPPALHMIDHCRYFIDNPPPDDWDGVRHMEEK